MLKRGMVDIPKNKFVWTNSVVVEGILKTVWLTGLGRGSLSYHFRRLNGPEPPKNCCTLWIPPHQSQSHFMLSVSATSIYVCKLSWPLGQQRKKSFREIQGGWLSTVALALLLLVNRGLVMSSEPTEIRISLLHSWVRLRTCLVS